MLELNQLYNMDCMDGMREFPDKYFDLAIVDPPYGKEVEVERCSGGRFCKYKIERTGGTWSSKYGSQIKHWDIAPEPEYFKELFRVSKNQIIWGGNYFALPPSRNFIVWRKLTLSENFSMAMAEYAWTNIIGNAKVFECMPQDSNRFHPTQKPVALYQWLLRHYANDGDKILDTHAGSASCLVACHGAGYNYVGFEIDKEYHRLAQERLSAVKAQMDLFHGEAV